MSTEQDRRVIAWPDKITPGQQIVRDWIGAWAFVYHTPEQLYALAAKIDEALHKAKHEAISEPRTDSP